MKCDDTSFQMYNQIVSPMWETPRKKVTNKIFKSLVKNTWDACQIETDNIRNNTIEDGVNSVLDEDFRP